MEEILGLAKPMVELEKTVETEIEHLTELTLKKRVGRPPSINKTSISGTVQAARSTTRGTGVRQTVPSKFKDM